MDVTTLLGKVHRSETTVRVNLDGRKHAHLDTIRSELAKATAEEKLTGGGLDSRSPQLAQDLAAATADMLDGATSFKFQAMRGEDLDVLTGRFPPTERQMAEWKEQVQLVPWATDAPQFDAEEVSPRLIAACLVEVDGEPVDWSEEDGLLFWAEIEEGVRADLLEAAWDVNHRRSARPTYGTGIATTLNTGPDSTIAVAEVFPSLSSLVE